MPLVRLDVAPDPAYVRVARLVAVSLARLHGVGEEVVEDVRLAVGDACGRAVAAQSRALIDGPVVVEFEGGTGLTVTVSDTVPLAQASGADAVALLSNGSLSDTATDTDPSTEYLEAPPEAIALLEGLADSVTVETGGTGTAVSLYWSRGT